MGKRRWAATDDDPRQVGKLGGRPRTAPRCACGAMTRKRAKQRRHRCA